MPRQIPSAREQPLFFPFFGTWQEKSSARVKNKGEIAFWSFSGMAEDARVGVSYFIETSSCMRAETRTVGCDNFLWKSSLLRHGASDSAWIT
jgi:hypothetical protein